MNKVFCLDCKFRQIVNIPDRFVPLLGCGVYYCENSPKRKIYCNLVPDEQNKNNNCAFYENYPKKISISQKINNFLCLGCNRGFEKEININDERITK